MMSNRNGRGSQAFRCPLGPEQKGRKLSHHFYAVGLLVDGLLPPRTEKPTRQTPQQRRNRPGEIPAPPPLPRASSSRTRTARPRIGIILSSNTSRTPWKNRKPWAGSSLSKPDDAPLQPPEISRRNLPLLQPEGRHPEPRTPYVPPDIRGRVERDGPSRRQVARVPREFPTGLPHSNSPALIRRRQHRWPGTGKRAGEGQ